MAEAMAELERRSKYQSPKEVKKWLRNKLKKAENQYKRTKSDKRYLVKRSRKKSEVDGWKVALVKKTYQTPKGATLSGFGEQRKEDGK